MTGWPAASVWSSYRLIDVVIQRVGLLLKAICIEVLLKITLLVQYAYANQGNAQIAGAFEMIAAEHAQAAGVILQALGQAELHRKVSDERLTIQLAVLPGKPGMLRAQVLVEGPADAGIMRHEGRIENQGV